MSKIMIGEEEFYWHEENGKFFLTHDAWSLSGSGYTKYDSIVALLDHIKIIYDDYASTPDRLLTSKAIKLKIFLISIMEKEQ